MNPPFRNYYIHCKTQWDLDWSCQCDDMCPVCKKDIMPWAIEDLNAPVENLKVDVPTDWVPEGGWPDGVSNLGELIRGFIL